VQSATNAARFQGVRGFRLEVIEGSDHTFTPCRRAPVSA
jgi:hypothetical protein